MSARKHKIMVSLNDQEAARLDEIRGDQQRATYLRRLLHEPPKGTEIATHGESLGILSRLARDGRTTAAIALERALRGGDRSTSELEEFLPWHLTTWIASAASPSAS